MARVTVEDCVLKVPNRFELVMLAAQRARNLGAGATLSVDRDNDKNPVVALREIAEGMVDLGELENNLVRGLQKVVEADEPEGDELDLLGLQKQIGLPEEAQFTGEMVDDAMRLEDEDGVEIVEEDDLDGEPEPRSPED